MASERPWKPVHAKEMCNYCMKEVGRANLMACSQCRFVRYCSRECQVAAWRTHKKSCKSTSQMHESISKDQRLYRENERLSKWVNTWRMTLTHWSQWAMKLNDSPDDKLSTHYFVLQLKSRPSSSPAQFFTIHKAQILPRTSVHTLLIEKDTPSEFLEDWLADQRGDQTAQIMILAERFVRMLYYSIQNPKEAERSKQRVELDKRLGDPERWVPALIEAVERGDVTAHTTYILQCLEDVEGDTCMDTDMDTQGHQDQSAPSVPKKKKGKKGKSKRR